MTAVLKHQLSTQDPLLLLWYVKNVWNIATMYHASSKLTDQFDVNEHS